MTESINWELGSATIRSLLTPTGFVAGKIAGKLRREWMGLLQPVCVNVAPS